MTLSDGIPLYMTLSRDSPDNLDDVFGILTTVIREPPASPRCAACGEVQATPGLEAHWVLDARGRLICHWGSPDLNCK